MPSTPFHRAALDMPRRAVVSLRRFRFILSPRRRCHATFSHAADAEAAERGDKKLVGAFHATSAKF